MLVKSRDGNYNILNKIIILGRMINTALINEHQLPKMDMEEELDQILLKSSESFESTNDHELRSPLKSQTSDFKI